MAFEIGQELEFGGAPCVVRDKRTRGGETSYLIESGAVRMPMWIPEEVLADQAEVGSPPVFEASTPAIIVVDGFFSHPDQIRRIALAQDYGADIRYFKGLRSDHRFLWPGLREEFGRLLGRPVTEWLGHNANGVFQKTNHDDQLVYHHDSQQYAAAVYLTPDGPASGGTSFWRDRVHGCRRSPNHPLEVRRLRSPEAIRAAEKVIYDQDNLVNPDGWELVEAVAGLYNRLVIWDAKLIHSATSYEAFGEDETAPSRLVQLFFFDAA